MVIKYLGLAGAPVKVPVLLTFNLDEGYIKKDDATNEGDYGVVNTISGKRYRIKFSAISPVAGASFEVLSKDLTVVDRLVWDGDDFSLTSPKGVLLDSTKVGDRGNVDFEIEAPSSTFYMRISNGMGTIQPFEIAYVAEVPTFFEQHTAGSWSYQVPTDPKYNQLVIVLQGSGGNGGNGGVNSGGRTTFAGGGGGGAGGLVIGAFPIETLRGQTISGTLEPQNGSGRAIANPTGILSQAIASRGGDASAGQSTYDGTEAIGGSGGGGGSFVIANSSSAYVGIEGAKGGGGANALTRANPYTIQATKGSAGARAETRSPGSGGGGTSKIYSSANSATSYPRGGTSGGAGQSGLIAPTADKPIANGQGGLSGGFSGSSSYAASNGHNFGAGGGGATGDSSASGQGTIGYVVVMAVDAHNPGKLPRILQA